MNATLAQYKNGPEINRPQAWSQGGSGLDLPGNEQFTKKRFSQKQNSSAALGQEPLSQAPLNHERLRVRPIELCAQSRKMEGQIIELLQDVEARRLYLDWGFSSLYDFAIQDLKMSESEAYRRISAMRALKGLPEMKAKLAAGVISVSNLAQVQKCVRAQEKWNEKPLSLEQKRDLIAKVENKSAREAERLLLEEVPELKIPQESIKPISVTHHQVKLVIEQSLMDKLEALKMLMSHKNPNFTLTELIEELADQALKKWDKATTTSPPVGRSRYIPADVKRRVWQRDGGCCSYTSSETGHRCKSRHQLQLDHVHLPWAKGGANTLENLALRCRAHNLHGAVQEYGLKHMCQWVDG